MKCKGCEKECDVLFSVGLMVSRNGRFGHQRRQKFTSVIERKMRPFESRPTPLMRCLTCIREIAVTLPEKFHEALERSLTALEAQRGD